MDGQLNYLASASAKKSQTFFLFDGQRDISFFKYIHLAAYSRLLLVVITPS